MKKFLFMVICILMVFGATTLFAQEANATELDPDMIELILKLGGFLGSAITVPGLTEMFKRWLKAKDGWAYVISFGVSAVASAAILFLLGQFAVLLWVGYSLAVFLTANGWYKFSAKAPQGK